MSTEQPSEPTHPEGAETLISMHILSLIQPKPEYVFRPSQIIRRLIREYAPTNEYEQVMLPWGLPIRIRPHESVGSWIWRLGVMELPVSETIYRLSDPGELAVDVGAHIGHMTSIMACRVGPTGRVLSFEPHPLTFDELASNVQRWAGEPGIAPIRTHPIALSDARRAGILEVPGDDSVNRARAAVAQNGKSSGSGYAIKVRPLVEFIPEGEVVGVMKLDVEGGEYDVLKGAETALRRHAIRDIIFEEYNPYPTRTTAFLEEAGYTIFSVGLSLWGLVVNRANTKRTTRSGYIPTYLATCDPDRALRRLEKRGWVALRAVSSRRL